MACLGNITHLVAHYCCSIAWLAFYVAAYIESGFFFLFSLRKIFNHVPMPFVVFIAIVVVPLVLVCLGWQTICLAGHAT